MAFCSLWWAFDRFKWGTLWYTHDSTIQTSAQRQFLELPPAADYKARLVELVESFSALLSGSMELFSWYIEKIIFASTMESDWRDCEQLGVANEVLNDYNEVRSGCWSFWHVTFGSGCGFQFQWNKIFRLPSQKVSGLKPTGDPTGNLGKDSSPSAMISKCLGRLSAYHRTMQLVAHDFLVWDECKVM